MGLIDRQPTAIAHGRGHEADESTTRDLIDRQIFVVDVAGGDKVPRKGGPGVTAADLLVINKTDLAPLVGASLEVMARDAAARRGAAPTVFLSLVDDPAATVATATRSSSGSIAARPAGNSASASACMSLKATPAPHR